MGTSHVKVWWETVTGIVGGAVALGLTLLSVAGGVVLLFSLDNPWVGATAVVSGLFLFALFYAHRLRVTSTTPVGRSADQELYRQLVVLLPSNRGPIDFLGRESLSYFPDDLLPTLREFYRGWSNTEHEFHDPEVETSRVNLLGAVGNFLEVLVPIVGPVRRDQAGSPLGIPVEWKAGDGSRYQFAYRTIEEAGDRVVAAHQDFIRIARSRLDD